MLKTSICDILGIEYPIIQGGMAWVATAELAAAVSEAGGLGIIAAGNMKAEAVREEIKKLKKMTDKPYGVNIMFRSRYLDEVMNVVIEERVPVITTGAGNPGKYVPRLKEIGTKVIPVVASVALAKRLARSGVDMLIAEGTESGGHIGELTTMALVPQIVDAVDIPVIAAGGIADGRGIMAAFSLGAQGVQLGTIFICAEECIAHDNFKNAVIKAGDRDTAVTGRSTGHPIRSLRNKLTRLYEETEKKGASEEELEQLGIGRLRQAVIDGDVEYGAVMLGQISGLVKSIKPAKQIIKELADDVEKEKARMKDIMG
ncbi:MAG: enoyl-[acyl-carrier-protein] reductase FabK [bacterium]